MYICIHIQVFKYAFIYTFMCAYTHWWHMWIYIHIDAHIYIHTRGRCNPQYFVATSSDLFRGQRARLCAWMHVYTCMRLYVSIYLCMYIYWETTYKNTLIYWYVYACVYMCLYVWIRYIHHQQSQILYTFRVILLWTILDVCAYISSYISRYPCTSIHMYLLLWPPPQEAHRPCYNPNTHMIHWHV